MFEISLSLLSAFGSGCMVFRKQNQLRDKSDKGQGNGLKLSNVEPGQFLDGRPGHHLDGRPSLKLSNVEPGQYFDGRPSH